MTAGSQARAAEVFSKFADELKQQPGLEFAELRVIALLNLCRMQERLGQTQESERTRQEAIALLEGDPLLAEAYGTQGLILRDRGLDEPSLDWFRKSRVEHARQPSPNIGQLSEALANEAAALARLGRSAEASTIDQQRARCHGDLPPLLKHEVTPVAKPGKQAGDAPGKVLIELDGLHLPESVYRDCDVATLENRLEAVLEGGEHGELDGHETGPENTTLFLYGADAEALFRVVEPVLRDYPLCHGARVTIRQEHQERRVVLS
jgi:tetratricopeptide (TPR) repeat protein